nr:putative reverse transcriptase domain-containing protein [Tanacetum cinerariifolium]
MDLQHRMCSAQMTMRLIFPFSRLRTLSLSSIITGYFSAKNHLPGPTDGFAVPNVFITDDYAPHISLLEATYVIFIEYHHSFDVIVGMDWLSKRKFVIVCHEKVVKIPLEGDEILRVHGERTQGVVKTLMNTKSKKEHEVPLMLVLESLRKEKLYVKFSKCEFWLKEVHLLNHVVNHNVFTWTQVEDRVWLKVTPWKGVVHFGKKEEIKIDKTLCLVEEHVEIMDQEIKKLKHRKIALVKVRWNSKRGIEFTWEHEDQMRTKYPQLFVDRVVEPAS